ncbi:hypothetical protein HELRODRAFT_172436 [Helobdella robusta]|uniref:Uncharacterized protein n=1 Tax=Helobdella robusta TaxID=6412 RepID=T1F5B9_HELRO|nr:hypothetical protein HELRODRAFT_172436 [Helobdella robusta]ESO04765.1 hypothetical protein HELRODRAFT_172436 [Helobdella robusta]
MGRFTKSTTESGTTPSLCRTLDIIKDPNTKVESNPKLEVSSKTHFTFPVTDGRNPKLTITSSGPVTIMELNFDQDNVHRVVLTFLNEAGDVVNNETKFIETKQGTTAPTCSVIYLNLDDVTLTIGDGMSEESSGSFTYSPGSSLSIETAEPKIIMNIEFDVENTDSVEVKISEANNNIGKTFSVKPTNGRINFPVETTGSMITFFPKLADFAKIGSIKNLKIKICGEVSTIAPVTTTMGRFTKSTTESGTTPSLCRTLDIIKDPNTKVESNPKLEVSSKTHFTFPVTDGRNPKLTITSSGPVTIMELNFDQDNVQRVVLTFLNEAGDVVNNETKFIETKSTKFNFNVMAKTVIVELFPEIPLGNVVINNMEVWICGEPGQHEFFL